MKRDRCHKQTRSIPTQIDKEKNLGYVSKLTKRRNNAKKDFTTTAVLKSKNGSLLTTKEELLERWREHFDMILNEEFPKSLNMESETSQENMEPFTEEEERQTLKQMRRRKA